MLDGYKTYVGLLIALLGVLGVGRLFTEGELEKVVDIVIQLVGIGIGAYGRYKATCND